MWNGTLTKASEVIDKFGFEVWIREKDSDVFLEGSILDQAIFEEVEKIDNIKDIEQLIYIGSLVESEVYTMSCMLIGFDINSNNVQPWDIIEGKVEDLSQDNAIILDRSFKDFFEDIEVGDTLIVGAVEMEIVGFCKNARFMANPYVWASLETARKTIPWAGEWCSTIGIKLENGYKIDEFKEDIDKIEKTNEIDEVEVLSTEELRQNAYSFIVNEGGMGGSIYILVIIGFLVAMIIITVSMYQTIQEKIPEFGTLKAIGASKGFINKIDAAIVFKG